MSLRKKVILSFVISAMLVAVFMDFTYTGFREVEKEIKNLELSDTIRSKSLQLRRHEKNFFLYREVRELEEVYRYINELNSIIEQQIHSGGDGNVGILREKVREYHEIFKRIEANLIEFQKEFNRLKASDKRNEDFFPLMEYTILERPLLNAEILKSIFPESKIAKAVGILKELGGNIDALRKTGEEILVASKELDRQARRRAENTIGLSKRLGRVLLPVSLVMGLVTLLLISHNVVKRLEVLTKGVEATGKGVFRTLSMDSEDDEVGMLIKAFNRMEENLMAREGELQAKNEELLRSRKLASVGTLASGVAHELNNPLNNIYLASQILSKEVQKQGSREIIMETVDDISSQALRVKRIVSDLLSFTREKPVEKKPLVISDIIGKAFKELLHHDETFSVRFTLDVPPDAQIVADEALMEQAFVNLFGNALDAMRGIQGKGCLSVTVKKVGDAFEISVSDTGKGIMPENLNKIFDPFFSTKEKGTGLGLSIVYNIIERHKGKIQVESKPGKGTTFKLTLPVNV